MGDRFRWTPPWKLTSAGLLFGQGIKGTFVGFSSDEYHNSTFYFMVPLVGFFTVLYGQKLNFDTFHLDAMCGDETEGLIDPDCTHCAEILGWMLIDRYAAKQRPVK